MASTPLPTPIDWKEYLLEIIGIAATVAGGIVTGQPATIVKAIAALDDIIIKTLAAKRSLVGTLIDESSIKPIDPIP